ncbi:MAG: hypothetical protein OHK0046_14890 [Anaerolineae bacterium]
MGGKCSHCGYDKNLAALTFHHTEDKTYPVDLRNLANRNIDSLLKEFEKCVLLCANCHFELHHPHLETKTRSG